MVRRAGLQGVKQVDGEPCFRGKAERLAPLEGAGCGAQGREGPERSGGPHRPHLPYSGSVWRARALGGPAYGQKNLLQRL